MSQQPKSENAFSNPQVIIAGIGGLATLLAALIGILPNLLQPPAPTPTPLVITATIPVITAATPIIAPTLPAASTLPPAVPTTAPTNPAPVSAPNVTLLYDEVAFNVVNASGGELSLEGVVFQSSAGTWDAQGWGASLYTSVPDGYCLRLRDATVGQRQPPAPCRDRIYSLIEAGTSALFWRNVDQFEVLQNGAVIATCTVSAGECEVFVGQ